MRIGRAIVAVALVGIAMVVAQGAPASPARAAHATVPSVTLGAATGATSDRSAAVTATIDPGTVTIAPKPDVLKMTFASAALARTMPYSVYLPPDYATSTQRYPVLYMLHGMSGTNDEWRGYGILDRADQMIRAGQLSPLIIVLPQGDKAYWVDHALPTDKEAWGRYMAKDVVAEVDARFRTVADPMERAIGGVSMGAHGAIQIAMNYPGTFTVVGAHSLVLRRYDTAPAYFGSQAEWSKRDPMQLVYSKTDAMKRLDIWIDIGASDPWAKLAEQFNGELDSLAISHQWHEWSGDHSASYWCAHLTEYLRFYDRALGAHQHGMAAGQSTLI